MCIISKVRFREHTRPTNTYITYIYIYILLYLRVIQTFWRFLDRNDFNISPLDGKEYIICVYKVCVRICTYIIIYIIYTYTAVACIYPESYSSFTTSGLFLAHIPIYSYIYLSILYYYTRIIYDFQQNKRHIGKPSASQYTIL